MSRLMSAFGTKRTSNYCPPMSAFGVKRTSRLQAGMSAFDPKQTSPALLRSPRWRAQARQRHSIMLIRHPVIDGVKSKALGLDITGQLTAIGGELHHDLPVQPDIHGSRVIGVASVLQFLGEFLARV
jgi:hypothetical protein